MADAVSLEEEKTLEVNTNEDNVGEGHVPAAAGEPEETTAAEGSGGLSKEPKDDENDTVVENETTENMPEAPDPPTEAATASAASDLDLVSPAQVITPENKQEDTVAPSLQETQESRAPETQTAEEEEETGQVSLEEEAAPEKNDTAAPQQNGELLLPEKSLADDIEDDDEVIADEVEQSDENAAGQSGTGEEIQPKNDDADPLMAEMSAIGAEIVFPEDKKTTMETWTNLKWMSCERKVRLCEICTRLVVAKRSWFSAENETYVGRKLAIYENPNLILILRPPKDVKELAIYLGVNENEIDPSGRKILIAESVIDPLTCKLKVSPMLTVTSVDMSGGEHASDRRKSCFELITPSGNVVLSAMLPQSQNSIDAPKAKRMEHAIWQALHDAHLPSDNQKITAMSWKHQLVLGTLSSYVVSGTQRQLEMAISVAKGRTGKNLLPAQIIDEADDSGWTALHYACAKRASSAITVLIGAGADASIPIPTEDGSIFPVHFSAKKLDHISLSTILSAPRRPNPNSLDCFGRTAMYVAATEGIASNGLCDAMALGKCLSALDAWGGQMVLENSTLEHPVGLLASRWDEESVVTLLSHQPFRFPLPHAGSLGALYQYPVHQCLISLREKIHLIEEGDGNQGFGGLDTNKKMVTGTIKALLGHGFEPNERVDRLGPSGGGEKLRSHFGFTPLQIVVAAALDFGRVNRMKNKPTTSILASISSVLSAVSDLLIKSGARTNIEVPPKCRLIKKTSSVSENSNESKVCTGDLQLVKVDTSALKVDGNREVQGLLGGEPRLSGAKKIWAASKAVPSTARVIINDDNREVADSEAAGGSSEKSCAICWSHFRPLVNRKHKCRVSLRYVCDECSKKRILDESKEHRLSDGQFLLATADIERQKAEKLLAQQETLRQKKAEREARLKQAESENAKKGRLFGNLMEKATNFIAGEETEDQVSSLQATLGQTADALNERGQKLSSLEEKTAKLMNASEEFAQMAKELEKSQKGWW